MSLSKDITSMCSPYFQPGHYRSPTERCMKMFLSNLLPKSGNSLSKFPRKKHIFGALMCDYWRRLSYSHLLFFLPVSAVSELKVVTPCRASMMFTLMLRMFSGTTSSLLVAVEAWVFIQDSISANRLMKSFSESLV